MRIFKKFGIVHTLHCLHLDGMQGTETRDGEASDVTCEACIDTMTHELDRELDGSAEQGRRRIQETMDYFEELFREQQGLSDLLNQKSMRQTEK